MDSLFQPVGPPISSALEKFCSSSFLFLKDVLSGREFLVDSGASVSVFPGPRSSSDDGVQLLTADGSPMICSGTHNIPPRFSCCSGSRVYSWNFQLAPVSVPLLSVDFLEYFACRHQGPQVSPRPEDVVIQASPGPQPAFKSVSFLSVPREIQELLGKYADVLFSDKFKA